MLTEAEIALINKNRASAIAERKAFMELASAICAETGVPFDKITAPRRGKDETCNVRNLICRIASDRGFPIAAISRYISRDRASVKHAIQQTRGMD